MFGGYGFFAPNGGMFAGIVTDDRIIFKLADEKARQELAAVGGEAWIYPGDGKPMTMREWILAPDAFYDEPELMQQWAARAHKLVPGKVKKPAAKKSAVARKIATKEAASKKKTKPAKKKLIRNP